MNIKLIEYHIFPFQKEQKLPKKVQAIGKEFIHSRV